MIRALLALLLLLAPAAQADPLRIVALGDMPNGPQETVLPPFRALIEAINAAEPDLVIHIGDTKSSGAPCTDARRAQELAHLNAFAAPTLFTPGDNDWTDCHFDSGGGHDPRERLARLREEYFADPAASFGARPAALVHQGAEGFPENARLMRGGVMAITAHVVGSNNGFELRDLAAAEEALARSAASARWIRESLAAAAEAEAAAAVVALHANMFQFAFDEYGRRRWMRHSGYAEVGPALREAAAAFGRPVLLVHGDSHRFRLRRPFPRRAPGLMALEVFGAPSRHAVEITADPDRPGVFGIRPLLNPHGAE